MKTFCGTVAVFVLTASALIATPHVSYATHNSNWLASIHDNAQCEQSKESYIEVDNTRVRYVEAGSGPVVVMIHGNAGSIDDFDLKAFGLLCRDHRVIALDRPGHGKSERSNGSKSSLTGQTRLIHDAVGQLGVTRPVIVGHSWGGSLALAYAVDFPNDVSAIVLLAPAAYEDGGGDEFMRGLIKTPVIGDMTLFVGRVFLGKHVLKKELNKAFYPDSVPDEYLDKAASTWLGHKQAKAFIDDEYSLNKDLNRISKHYHNIKIPVVIVTGDQDKVVVANDNAYRLKKTIAQSQMIELKNTGHQIPQTHPESVTDAVNMIQKSAATARAASTNR